VPVERNIVIQFSFIRDRLGAMISALPTVRLIFAHISQKL
jgi:hypothetical protein